MFQTLNIKEGVSIKRNHALIHAGIALFEWLHELQYSHIVVLNDKRNEFINLEKKPHEKIILDLDHDLM